MSTQDTVLSLDGGPEDYLYRILRKDGREQRVVYVLLQHLDLIPQDSRTYGPEVIQALSKLADWTGRWKTLTISKGDSGIQTRANVFEPHRLPRGQLQSPAHDRLFNIFDLQPAKSVKSRVTPVQANGKKCILKIARFEFEVSAVAQEARAYESLTRQDRVIGFVTEEISGYHPTTKHLAICEEALQRLHGLNVIHGDIDKYNILVAQDGVKFIGLEASEIDLTDRAQMDKYMQDLKEGLEGSVGYRSPVAVNGR